MRGIVRILGASLALAIIFGALPALAAEGRIPIWQPIQIFPGMEGKYVVTRNLSANPGMPIIDILGGTVSVEIDLNGFTLYGLDTDVIRAVGVDSLTIRNGTLMFGIGHGITVSEARKVVVEDVKIQFVGQRGIELNEVSEFALRRNIIVFTEQGEAIFVDGSAFDPTQPTSGTIEDNLTRSCMRGITLYFGSSVRMHNNRIEQSFVDGIFISPGPNADAQYGCVSCILSENTIQESGANGMWLSHFEVSKVYNNTVIFSGNEGIFLDVLSDDNLVLDNVSSQNGANGLIVDSNQNHIERNVLNSNNLTGGGFWGLWLRGFGNTYRGNTAQGNNGFPPLCPGFPATTDFCDAGGGNVSPLNQPPTLAGDNLMPGLL